MPISATPHRLAKIGIMKSSSTTNKVKKNTPSLHKNQKDLNKKYMDYI